MRSPLKEEVSFGELRARTPNCFVYANGLSDLKIFEIFATRRPTRSRPRISFRRQEPANKSCVR